MADFYNLADKELFKKYQYLPQEKYRLGLNLPTAATEDQVVTDQGIVNTNAFANTGGDGPDPNTIVNQNYDPYPYRNASEMSFVGATDPKYFNQSYDPSGKIANAQTMYNKASADAYRYSYPANQLAMTETFTGMRPSTEVMDYYNEQIMDNKEQYGAQGQYETVPSELAYSTDTAAQKMMDNYPGYYEDDDEEPTGIRALISKGVNLIPGMGMARTAANVLGGLMPVNQTAILRNELAGFGIGVNDQGRIVGDRNTLEGIMAGKNFSRLDENSLDKQIETLRNTLGKDGKYGLSKEVVDAIQSGKITDEDLEEQYGITTDLSNRLRLSGLGKEQLKEIIKRKDTVFDYNKKQKDKKKKDTTTTTGNDQDGGTTTTTSSNTTGGTGTVATTSPDYTPRGPNQPDPGNNNDGGAGEGPSNRGRNSSQRGGGFNNLGFSDIRLKENVELIGKSPSNINIYKFNYKDSSTTYQGAMAHEVPWASVQHSNGYMMIDYSKIDVKLKKI